MPRVRRSPQRLLVVLVLFAAGLGLTLLPATERAHADNICTPDASWGTVNSGYAAQVVSLVNQHRASLGLGQLAVDSALTRSAVWKSMNMAGLGYFDHTDDPIGRSVGQRLSDCGWPSNLGWGENIAYGYPTPDQVMTGWLNSAGHKANIENPSFTSIGVGVAADAQGGYYWTQDFGQGSSGGASPPPPPPPTTTTPPPAPPPPATTSPPTPTPAPPTNTPPPGTTPAAAPPVGASAPTPTAKVKAEPKTKQTHRKAKKHKVVAHPRALDNLNLNELHHL